MKIIIKFVVILLLFWGCEEETIKPNPVSLIQGKWKIVMIGNGDNLLPYETQYIIEYYNDSLLREYDTAIDQYTFYAKFTIDDNLLIEHYYYEEDTLFSKFEYEFYDENRKLKLIRKNLIANFNTQVLQRQE